MDNSPKPGSGGRQLSRSRWALMGFLAIAAFFLLSEHRAHFLGILPYLLVLACPLMHFFHHRHHGHMNGDSGRTTADTGAPGQGAANPREKS